MKKSPRIFIEKKLGPRAIEFIKSRLCEGKTLSKFLLNKNFESGTVITKALDSIDEEQLYDFKSGKIFTGKVITQNEWLSSQIQEFLTEDKNNVVVFELFLALKNDKWLRKENNKNYFYFQNQVYSYLTYKENKSEIINKTIQNANSAWPGVVCVFSNTENQTIQINNKNDVEEELLNVIAINSKKIALGIYDGESYLLWSKSDI